MVRFVRKDGKPDEEYYYQSRKDAEYHFHLFDNDDSVIPVITREDFIRYQADGTISGGMIPKIENAFSAIDQGVQQVIITLATAIDGHHGTVIKK